MKTKRITSAILCLIMAFALLPTTAFAIDPFSLKIGNATIADDSPGNIIRYFKNADFLTGNPTGSESDYNAYYDKSDATLYLKNANLQDFNGSCVNVTRTPNLYVSLAGSNVFSSSAASGAPAFFTQNNLTVSGDSGASLTAEAKGFAFGISASEVMVSGGNVTGKSAGSTAVLAQSGDVSVSGGSLTGITTGSYYGVYAGGSIAVGGSGTLTGASASGVALYAASDYIGVYDDASLHASGNRALNVEPDVFGGDAIFAINGRLNSGDTQDSALTLSECISARSLHITPKPGVFVDKQQDLSWFVDEPFVLKAEPQRLTGSFGYQWDRVINGVPTEIGGATEQIYEFTPRTPGSYTFRCRVTHGQDTYSGTWEGVIPRLFYMTNTAFETTPGSPVTLYVYRRNYIEHTYKWYKNTTNSTTGGTLIAEGTGALAAPTFSHNFTPTEADVGKTCYVYALINDQYYTDIAAVRVLSAEQELVLTDTATGELAVQGTDYTYADFTMTLIKAGSYTLSLRDGLAASGHVFAVGSGVSGSVALTLDGVTLTFADNSVATAYRIACANTNVAFELKLKGDNALSANSGVRATGNMTITGDGSLAFTGTNQTSSTGIACNGALEIGLGASGRITLTGANSNMSYGIAAPSGSYRHTGGTLSIANFNTGVSVNNFTMTDGALNITGAANGFTVRSGGKAEFDGGVTDIVATNCAIYGYTTDANASTAQPTAHADMLIMGSDMTVARGGSIQSTSWTYDNNMWRWFQTVSESTPYIYSSQLQGASASVRIQPTVMPALTGTVSITGEAKFGVELTAAVTNTNNTGALFHQWKRGGTDIEGASSATYTPVLADINQILTCEVTSSIQTGAISKTTGTVEKADGPAAPIGLTGVAPTTGGGSDGKIVGTSATMEYSTTAGFASTAPCGDPETGSLTANTYYVRYKDTATHKAGAAATVVVNDGATQYRVTLNFTLDGAAYTGQTVTIQEGSGTVYTLTEGTNGAYTNTAVPNGTYTIYKGGVSTGKAVTVNNAGGSADLVFFTVSFNANGGTPAPAAQVVVKDGYAAEPASMTKETDAFDGWYSNLGLTTPWTFATSKVTDTITIYAKWTSAPPAFVPVTSITRNFAATVATNTDLPLAGTVEPSNATNQTIVWSVSPNDANTTGAAVDSSGVFTATTAGTATVRATVVNGLTESTDYTQDFDIVVSAAPVATYTVTVTGGTGGGEYAEGDTVTIVAGAPEANKRFKEWTVSPDVIFTTGGKTTSTATFTMPGQAVSATATYEDIPATTYTVTYDRNGGSGTMANGTATPNVAFTLPGCTFTAPTGQQFKEWAIGSTSGTKVAAGSEYTFTADTTVYAVWENQTPTPTQHTITVSASPTAGGVVSGGGTYDDGHNLTVTATANANYRFVKWTEGGAQVSTSANYTFQVTADRTLVAVFEANTNPPASDNTITGVTAGQSYTLGDTVTFTANGGGMNNTAPNMGDMRWLPTAWAANPSGNFSGGYTQSFSTTGMTLGIHTLTVTFAKQRYNGTAWANISPAVTDTKSVSFTLLTGPTPVVPPTIDAPDTAPDRTVTVVVGNTATMSVTATGATSYQWYKSMDDGRNFSPISGATGASYTTSPVTMANNGYWYYCIATNSAGSTRSCTFVLNVIEQPDIPATGDNSQLVLWLGIMLMAGAVLTGSAVLMRRKRAQ